MLSTLSCCCSSSPQDDEAFLHRSGRTGRAGNTGTAVVLFTERDARSLGMILKATKVENAELIGGQDPADVVRQASKNVLNKLDKVSHSSLWPRHQSVMSSLAHSFVKGICCKGYASWVNTGTSTRDQCTTQVPLPAVLTSGQAQTGCVARLIGAVVSLL